RIMNGTFSLPRPVRGTPAGYRTPWARRQQKVERLLVRSFWCVRRFRFCRDAIGRETNFVDGSGGWDRPSDDSFPKPSDTPLRHAFGSGPKADTCHNSFVLFSFRMRRDSFPLDTSIFLDVRETHTPPATTPTPDTGCPGSDPELRQN